MTASNETAKKSMSYSRRNAAQLIMGVAALGLALGKTPVGAAETSVKMKEKVLSSAEKVVYHKLSAREQGYFLKLDAGERSTFLKHEKWSSAEKSNFLKVQSTD